MRFYEINAHTVMPPERRTLLPEDFTPEMLPGRRETIIGFSA